MWPPEEFIKTANHDDYERSDAKKTKRLYFDAIGVAL
jgi:hypothetical protein